MIVLFVLLMLALPMFILPISAVLPMAILRAIYRMPSSLPRLVLDYLTHLGNRVLRE
jgi:hypothetical protein